MNDSLEYKGHTINIVNDDSPMNPFEDFDGLPNLLVNYDSTLTEYGDIDIDDILIVEDIHIKKSLNTIKNAIEDTRPLLTILRSCDYVNTPRYYGCAIDCLNAHIKEYYDGLIKRDQLLMLSTFLDIKKVKHLLTESRGYSQGDYVEMLLIANDESDTIESLQGAADTYSAWAWGDVYGYIVEGHIGELDCWGFYGSDHNTSGLIEHAKNAIDCEIAYNRKQKLIKLKTLIKNGVPIDKRAQLLIIA